MVEIEHGGEGVSLLECGETGLGQRCFNEVTQVVRHHEYAVAYLNITHRGRHKWRIIVRSVLEYSFGNKKPSGALQIKTPQLLLDLLGCIARGFKVEAKSLHRKPVYG